MSFHAYPNIQTQLVFIIIIVVIIIITLMVQSHMSFISTQSFTTIQIIQIAIDLKNYYSISIVSLLILLFVLLLILISSQHNLTTVDSIV